MNLGEYLIALLEQYEVDTIFGIPGVHTAEMYRGLAKSPIRHITPRHEQGAGFMADGYARISGKPGVCLLITGPGLSNCATAMLQAKADSIPMLVISGVNARGNFGSGRGHLHEMPDQRAFAEQCAVFSHTILRPEDLPDVVARAFAVFEGGRPGPVHIEIPLDLMGASVEALPAPARAPRLDPAMPANLDAAFDAIRAATRPVILVGGGARRGAVDALALAEGLDCPLIGTVNTRDCWPLRHPLVVPAMVAEPPVRDLIDNADLVLAFGTEMGPTEYVHYSDGGTITPQKLMRVDIDPTQLTRSPRADIALVGDAAATLFALRTSIEAVAPRGGAALVSATREAVLAGQSPEYRALLSTLDALRKAAPNAAMVGDSTQLIYAGDVAFEAGNEGRWFNSSGGYGTLGYGLPAAIGARRADPTRPVLCLIGDGGIQFSLGELGAAVDEDLPIIVIVWNNNGYGEIRSFMEDRQIKPEGVNLTPPDFILIGRAYGYETLALEGAEGLAQVVSDAIASGKPTLLEVRGV